MVRSPIPLALAGTLAVPAAGGGTSQPAPSAGTRLAIRVGGEELAAALPQVGEGYRRKLTAGKNAAERRLMVFAPSRPLPELQKQLRRFVPYAPGTAGWFRSGATLVFDEDVASLQARLRQAQRAARAAAERRRAGYRQMREWAGTGESEMPGGDRDRATLGAYLDLLDGFPPEQHEAALYGRTVDVPFHQLSPVAQNRVQALVRGVAAGVEGTDERFVGSRDFDKVVVRAYPGGKDATGLGLTLQLTPHVGQGIQDILSPPRPDSEEPISPTVRAAARVRGPANRKTIQALQSRITLTPGVGRTIERVLEELAERSGVPVLAEYDPCFATPTDRLRSSQRTLPRGLVEDIPLWEALDRIAGHFDLEWEWSRGWIWIRSPRTVPGFIGLYDLSPPRNPERFSDYFPPKEPQQGP